MEKILENLVNNADGGDPAPLLADTNTPSSSLTMGDTNNQTAMPITSTNSRLEVPLSVEKEVNSSVEEEIDDVMNVLKDLNDVASGTYTSSTNSEVNKSSTGDNEVPHSVVESLTHVQDVAKVVDFSKACLNETPSQPPISAYQAAEEKFAKLSARQVEIEKRFESLNLRINQMRSRQFGSHTVNELTNLRSYYDGITAPLIQGTAIPSLTNLPISVTSGYSSNQVSRSMPSNPSLGSVGIQVPSVSNNLHQRLTSRPMLIEGLPLPGAPIQINSPAQPFPSQTIPSGIALSSLASIRAPPSLPTKPLAPSDIDASSNNFVPRSIIKSSVSGINITSPFPVDNQGVSASAAAIPSKKIKVEKAKKVKLGKDRTASETNVQTEHENKNTVKIELPTAEEKERMKDSLNHLEANLCHMIYSYDSEATESSSGGESCDEFDGYADTSYLQDQRDRESKLYQRLKNQQPSFQSTQHQGKLKGSTYSTHYPPPIKQRAKWAWLSNR